MKKNIFKEGDTVINQNNGKEYYIDKVEKIYNVDLKRSESTGYVSCRSQSLNDNLSEYNRFHVNDLKLKDH
ncbi:hypothetical protein [Parabacteroides pacaensis]|uniref:hypothetical protein n=1 Tax=Parabacteroides pacaensis TaxID=2086575 RepID=UPI000D0FD2E0|nr:hypothetical protein [Parabacteroides pacaensis]